MTEPTFLPCLCGHEKIRHNLAHMCGAPACTCIAYRPIRRTASGAVIPPQAAPTASPAPEAAAPSQSQAAGPLLVAAKRSESKRTVALAVKIEGLVDELRVRLAEEREAAEARRHADEATAAAREELAKLEARVAELRAQVKAKRTPPAVVGTHPCPDCPRTLSTVQALGSHRFRVHGYRKAG